MKIDPNIPKLNASPTMFATAKLRSRNSRSGSSGADVRDSQITKETSSTAPATSEPTTWRLSQPAGLPRTIPKITASTPRPASRRPTTSARSVAPKLFGRARRASGMAMMPTGTLSQKIPCQFQPSTTAPPTSGPAATPRPEMPPQMPMASGRRRAGTEPARRVSESGMSAAPPTPWMARAAMSSPGPVDSAAKAEAAVKTMMPATKTVRRPNRSPRATAMRMKPAKLSV